MAPLQMAWFPMQADVMGATGNLVKAEGYEPSEKGVLVYFTAPDLNAASGRAKERGGLVVAEKTSTGEYGFIGLIKDLEGNRIASHSRE